MTAAERRTLRVLLALAFLGAFLVLASRGAEAAENEEPSRPATFALIIGNNASVDPDVQPLKYADDDAARYLDLFRLLGARTYLLSRLDSNTRRLHPQAASEALDPRRANLDRVLAQIESDVTQARDRHLEAIFYFVYAGHGNVDESGEGYISLEDQRFSGADLARTVARIPATHVHVIVDACASYFLAYSRGPGGERRSVRGFQDQPQLSNDPRVGLLLSTSSARESHEWDEYQSGVFSHEVRSGLYGAADADGDGRVSYREIAAFVSRANAAIPNERYRPDVHARAPTDSPTLLDIRQSLTRRLDVSGAHASHYWIEDSQGVRLLDFHNGPNQTVHLVRPGPSGNIFLRRAEDGTEYQIPPWPSAIALDDLRPRPIAVASRGGAHESFGHLFSLPFDAQSVTSYEERPFEDPSTAPAAATANGVRNARDGGLSRGSINGGSVRPRVVGGAIATGFGAAALATGAILSVSATTISRDSNASLSEQSVAARNSRIGAENTAAGIAYASGGVTLCAGLALLLWPEARHVQASISPTGGTLGYGGSF